MATKSPTNVDSEKGSSRKPAKPLAVHWQPQIKRHAPFKSTDFSLRAYDARHDTWIYLEDFLTGMSWGDSKSEVAISGTITLNNVITSNGKRITDYLSDGTAIRFLYAPEDEKDQEICRFIVWGKIKHDESAGTAEVTVYDQLMHTKTSYDTFLYYASKKKTGWTAAEITKAVCAKHGIPIGKLPKCTIKIPYIYAENISIYDFLLMAWGQERKQTGRRFTIRMVSGRLTVAIKSAGDNTLMWELMGQKNGNTNQGALISASRSEGMDPGDASSGTATAVTVRGVTADNNGDKRTPVVSFTATDPVGIQKYGYIHKVIQVEGLTNKKACRLLAIRHLKSLNKPQREMNAESLGIPFLLAGHPIKVNNKDANLAGRYFITDITHTIDGSGDYKMSCTLSPFNDIEEIFASDTNLQAPGSSNGGGGKGDLPSWLYPIMKKATKAAGVPTAWADSKDLMHLLNGESSFNATAKNPGSTAYGLFQFLDDTWATVGGSKTSDPYLQCVYGLKYIKRVYGTPKKAYAKWKSRSPHWY